MLNFLCIWRILGNGAQAIGNTPVFNASNNGHSEVLSYLLSVGANPNYGNSSKGYVRWGLQDYFIISTITNCTHETNQQTNS